MATLEDFSSSDSDQECMVNDPICEPIDDDEPQTVAAVFCKFRLSFYFYLYFYFYFYLYFYF